MPVLDQYTHNFKFQIGDGGQYLEGEIEFNTDGKVSYKMSNWSEPIKNGTLGYFTELTELLKKIFHGTDPKGIKLIRFKIKD